MNECKNYTLPEAGPNYCTSSTSYRAWNVVDAHGIFEWMNKCNAWPCKSTLVMWSPYNEPALHDTLSSLFSTTGYYTPEYKALGSEALAGSGLKLLYTCSDSIWSFAAIETTAAVSMEPCKQTQILLILSAYSGTIPF
jgi:hypothetical protein